MPKNRRYAILTFFALAVLSGWLLHPALIQGQSLVHGDNLHHGYATLSFLNKLLSEGISPFWTNQVYGGHPLFAEGQAGLSNPLNILVALLFKPEFGHNLIHWLSMIGIGMGSYGLCRSLDISPASAMFAAIAAALSGLYILANSNMTGMEASIWIPWTLWAFEAWLKKPGLHRATLFGLATAMLVFSGYPHFFHGTVLYMLFSLGSFPWEREIKDNGLAAIKTYLCSGAWAVAVCVGISAFQWIPLLELAAYSHRQDGTSIAFDVSSEFYIRGLMYYIDLANAAWFYPITSSLVVCALASAVIFTSHPNLRLKGHLLAVFLLGNLAFAQESPLFVFARDYKLIPGMSSFRAMFPYFYIVVFGLCIFAAKSLDWLSREKILRGGDAQNKTTRLSLALLFVAGWAWLIHGYHIPEISNLHYVTLGVTVVLIVVSNLRHSQSYIPVLAVIVLVLEIILIRLAPFQFVDNEILTVTPEAVRIIQADPDAADYKHHHISVGGLAFKSPIDEDLETLARDELNHIVASTNLLWDISSFTGAFALKSERKLMINQHIEDEIKGSIDKPAGLRLIDILSIKYISTRRDYGTEAFEAQIKTRLPRTHIFMVNTAALPRFQTYRKTISTSDAKQAFEIIKQLKEKTLVIETDQKLPGFAAPTETASLTPPTLDLVHDSPTSYKLVTTAVEPFWLFLADANYPGWQAKVNGSAVQVYTAQILGKAIYIPAGENEVEIFFQSRSLRIGFALATFTVICIALAIARTRRIKPQTG